MASRSRWSNAAREGPCSSSIPAIRAARLDPQAPVLEALAAHARVIAPTHPGFGSTPAPRELTTVDDLAYLYLDLLDTLNLRDVVVVGVSLGGWIAAEMAVKSTERISALVLANAVGIKPGDRETRDIADIYAITDKQLAELVWADPARMAANPKTLPGERSHRHGALARIHRALRVVALYARSQAEGPAAPHPHSDAGAVGRGRPRGEDRIRAELCGGDPGARFETIEGAGHFPHLEQPQAFARAVSAFIDSNTRR